MIIKTLAIQHIARNLNKQSFAQLPNIPLFCCLCYYAVPDKETGFKDSSKIMCRRWGRNEPTGNGTYLNHVGPNCGKTVNNEYPLAHEMNPKGGCEKNYGLSRWQLIKRIVRPNLHPGPLRH